MSVYPGFNLNRHMTEVGAYGDVDHDPEEPVTFKGFSATNNRKFNLGNYKSLNPAITVWVKTNVPQGEAFDLHDSKNRLRQMARDNVRAQCQRLQGNNEVVFLGLRPPAGGIDDPVFVRTVSASLVYKVNLDDFNSISPGYSDWADLRKVAHRSRLKF